MFRRTTQTTRLSVPACAGKSFAFHNLGRLYPGYLNRLGAGSAFSHSDYLSDYWRVNI